MKDEKLLLITTPYWKKIKHDRKNITKFNHALLAFIGKNIYKQEAPTKKVNIPVSDNIPIVLMKYHE